MRNKTIVVTGGAGFIGSNLVWGLADENQVIVIDNLSTGHLKNIKSLIDQGKIRFVQGSITDPTVLDEVFSGVDVVFHQAAIPSVPRSVKDPLKSHEANVNGTLQVLLAARDNQVEKVVYASSSSVYGDSPSLPKHEEMNPNPKSPYAVSKLVGEYYCQVFTTVYGLKTVSLRYFNVFGPRQDPNGAYAAVIPKFIQLLSQNKSPVIYGDGEQSRDFTYIDNVVQANIDAASHPHVTGVFNVACGTKMTVNDLAYRLSENMEKNVDIVYEPPREGDILHSLADNTKAHHAFQYQPRISIEKGLQETIKWFQTLK